MEVSGWCISGGVLRVLSESIKLLFLQSQRAGEDAFLGLMAHCTTDQAVITILVLIILLALACHLHMFGSCGSLGTILDTPGIGFSSVRHFLNFHGLGGFASFPHCHSFLQVVTMYSLQNLILLHGLYSRCLLAHSKHEVPMPMKFG